MTTLLLHVLGAFVGLILLNRLFKFDISLEILILLSLTAILPDLIDKTLTGTRYPFHSFVVTGSVLLSLNIILMYYLNTHPENTLNNTKITNYLCLASLAILSHIILDLEGFVPIFYPLDLNGYKLEFYISTIQSFPPIISDFGIGFVVEPFDYELTYESEASLLTTLDVLLIVVITFPFIINSLGSFPKRLVAYFNNGRES
ncbi:MAG: hypothetical protein ACFE95_22680 [Candidatus Hodarchaeota archaeon]